MLYSDGTSPQDGLSKHDRRKLCALYWSILQFDSPLASEVARFTISCIRQHIIETIPGGLSRVCRDLLRMAFFNAQCDLRRGVELQRGVVITVDSLVVEADIPALAEMISSKGHNAFKCCLHCKNVYLRRYAHAGLESFLDHTSLEIDQIAQHTVASFREAIRRIREGAATLPPDKFAELLLVHGLNYNPEGLLFAEDLRLTPLNLMNDWNHTYLETGLLDLELGFLMYELRQQKAPATYAMIGEYVGMWQWPRQIGNHGLNLVKLFDAKSAHTYLTSKHFSSSASQLLSLVPTLSLFFERVAMKHGFFTQGVKSVLILCGVVGLLQLCRSRDSPVTDDALRSAVAAHLKAKFEAYGRDFARYKDHAAMHLADQKKRCKRLPPCFTQERLHKKNESMRIKRRLQCMVCLNHSQLVAKTRVHPAPLCNGRALRERRHRLAH